MKTVKAVLSEKDQITIGKRLEERHPRYGLLWRIGLETGLRISDILRLKVRCFKGKGIYEVREKKTKKKRKIEISEGLLKDIKRFKRQYGLQDKNYLIFSHPLRTNKPLSRQQAYNVIRTSAEEVGLKSIGTHSMRKTYSVNEFQKDGKVEVLQEKLNHQYASTTMIYLQDLFRVTFSKK